MTTATKITLVRIFLIPVFLVCMYLSVNSDVMAYVAFTVFVIASISDAVDGKIARKYNQITDLGKFLDPLADKVLVIAAMTMFCEWGQFPAWALMIVLTREFAVTGLRLIAVGNGRVIAAGKSGKIKTAVTMTGLCFMLCFRGSFFQNLLGATFMCWFNWFNVAAIVITTLYSGVEYFIKNWDVLKGGK